MTCSMVGYDDIFGHLASATAQHAGFACSLAPTFGRRWASNFVLLFVNAS
jgi:hypothetical protein